MLPYKTLPLHTVGQVYFKASHLQPKTFSLELSRSSSLGLRILILNRLCFYMLSSVFHFEGTSVFFSKAYLNTWFEYLFFGLHMFTVVMFSVTAYPKNDISTPVKIQIKTQINPLEYI